MLLITCDIDSRSVRSWYDRPIVYVAASPVEFMLPPTAFHGFVHFRPRTIVPRTARVVRTSKRWNASNGALPYGEANLWTKFRRGWKQLWLTLGSWPQMLRIRPDHLHECKRCSECCKTSWSVSAHLSIRHEYLEILLGRSTASTAVAVAMWKSAVYIA